MTRKIAEVAGWNAPVIWPASIPFVGGRMEPSRSEVAAAAWAERMGPVVLSTALAVTWGWGEIYLAEMAEWILAEAGPEGTEAEEAEVYACPPT